MRMESGKYLESFMESTRDKENTDTERGEVAFVESDLQKSFRIKFSQKKYKALDEVIGKEMKGQGIKLSSLLGRIKSALNSHKESHVDEHSLRILHRYFAFNKSFAENHEFNMRA
jgi:hypothetical protein